MFKGVEAMKKGELGYNEESLINNIVRINQHLLKDLIFNEESLKKELKFLCNNYLIKVKEDMIK